MEELSQKLQDQIMRLVEDKLQQAQPQIYQNAIIPGQVKPRHLVAGENPAGTLYQSDGTNFNPIPPGSAGSLFYYSTTPSWLPIGTTGQVLTVSGGLPSWQDIPESEWLTFSSTWTGFSSAPTNPISYNVSNNVCTMILDHTGVSNSATFDFTLPVACKQITGGNAYIYQPIKINNNSAAPTTMGVVGIPYNDGSGITAKVGVNLSTSNGNAFGGFTASSNKSVHGVIQYPV